MRYDRKRRVKMTLGVLSSATTRKELPMTEEIEVQVCCM